MLKLCAAERGGLPLVLATDNGPQCRSAEVARYLRRNQVLHLFNLPPTPQHNSWSEHGIGETKREALLAGPAAVPAPCPCQAMSRLLPATQTLDHGRLRSSRGWRTAAQADLELPHWKAFVDRGRLYAVARCRTAAAVLHSEGARDRRRAKREAIHARRTWTLDTNPRRRRRGASIRGQSFVRSTGAGEYEVRTSCASVTAQMVRGPGDGGLALEYCITPMQTARFINEYIEIRARDEKPVTVRLFGSAAR